jgi:NMD protein affecting ribosome stability and mRNA decay
MGMPLPPLLLQHAVTACGSCQSPVIRPLTPDRHWSSLNQVKLVDAGFIWTEPHSMRLKVKLTIQVTATSIY